MSRMRFSPLVRRIAGEGSDAWVTHYEAWADRERGEDVILLSVGDPDLDTPVPVVDTAVARLRAGDTHYTPSGGRKPLRDAIAARHCNRYGQEVGADNVIMLSGAQNALFVSMMCVGSEGDEIIALDPMYATYPTTVEAGGAKLVRAGSRAPQDFRPDLDKLAAAVTPRTRALLFSTPSNPSGVILNEEELAFIGELARRHDLWVIADQVYAGLAPGGRVPSLAQSMPDQVVTICSLSKTHAMPGWRVGWLIGPTEFVTHADHLAMCMLFGLPGFIQEAALTGLSIAEESEAHVRDYCSTRRDLMLAGLAGIPGLRCHVPAAGMFMLVDVSGTGLSGWEFMRALYAAEKVSVLDGGVFGRDTAGVVRICFAVGEKTIEDACVRIRRFVSSHFSRP
jgi:aspartate/methionine/tyrosine aminotransferase